MPLKIRFTEAVIDELPVPNPKQRVTYIDFDPADAKKRVAVPGLELVVSYTGVKSFVLRRKLKGRVVSVTIGRHPAITVETARKEARTASQQIAQGINPNQRKRADRSSTVTLEDCFKSYKADRKLAENTLANYKTVIDKHLEEWKRKPMNRITRDMVANKHRALTKKSPTSANKSMRVLRSLFNYAHGKYEDQDGRGLFPDNPVQRITHTKSWNAESRRSNTIGRTQLEPWYRAVRSLSESNGEFERTVGDYLLFVLLTGLRRREATSLRISDVDFGEKSFTVFVTKNRLPLALPMSDATEELLRRRCDESTTSYVFHGSGKDGRLNDPRRLIGDIRKNSEVGFTVHDLRRTFMTLAESLDVSAYSLKRLVNHSPGSDVTAGYIRMDVERLRKPTQEITDYIFKLAKVRESAAVLHIAHQISAKREKSIG